MATPETRHGSGWFITYRIELLLLACGSILIFANLGNMHLWQDEAETALLGRATLQHGYPYIWDGKNRITGFVGDYNTAGVHITHPWIQYYLAACSFAFLGESTFSARFPFAVLGVLALFLFYRISVKLFDSPAAARLMLLLLVSSVQYVLYIRQCRYYAPALCFSLWALLGYLKVIREERYGYLHVSLALVCLFHSFPVAFAGMTMGFAVHTLLFYRHAIAWKYALVALALIALSTLPFGYMQQSAFYQQSAFIASVQSHQSPIIEKILRLAHYLRDLNLYVAPLWALCLVVAWMGRTNRRHGWVWVGISGSLFGLLTLSSIYLLSSLSLYINAFGGLALLCGAMVFAWQSGSKSRHTRDIAVLGIIFMTTLAAIVFLPPLEYFRYTISLIPLCILGMGMILRRAYGKSPVGACALGIVILTSNVIPTFPYGLIKATGVDIRSAAPLIASRPVAWIAAIIANRSLEEARDVESVRRRLAVIRNQITASTPLRSYLYEFLGETTHDYDGPVEGICRYLTAHGSPDDTVMTNYADLPVMWYTGMRVFGYAHAFPADITPEWVIIRRSPLWDPVKTQRLKDLSRGYERIAIPYPDIPWGNLPDLFYHKFRTVRDEAPVKILKRRGSLQ